MYPLPRHLVVNEHPLIELISPRGLRKLPLCGNNRASRGSHLQTPSCSVAREHFRVALSPRLS